MNWRMWLFAGGISWAVSLSGFGQATTIAVFPQIVDGVLPDGSRYESQLYIHNIGANAATCSLSTAGIPVDRFVVTDLRTIPTPGLALNWTKVTDSFASGYAVVICSQPVQASLMYQEAGPDWALEGMATVLPAPPARYATFPVITGGRFTVRYGVAVANVNATPITLTFTVGLIDGTSTQKAVQIPAQSQFVDFLDDFLVLPAPTPATVTSPAVAGFATVTITSMSQFYVTALQYDGALFTTIAPAIQ